MRVSVILPAYNCAAYIGAAIRSVLAQTHPVHELIVLDDGSTDETPSVVKEFENSVVYIRTPNHGVAAARNSALTRATGDAIAFLDADDAWYPRKLELEVRVLTAHPEVDAVCTDFSLVDMQGTVQKERWVKHKYRLFDAYKLDWRDIFPSHEKMPDGDRRIDVYFGDAFRSLFLGNFVNTSSMLLKRQALDRAGRFTVGRRTQTDYEFWLKVARGGPMAFIDEPLLIFRRRPNQLTSDDQRLRVAQDVADVVVEAADAARGRLGEDVVAERVADRYYALATAFIGNDQAASGRHALAQAYARGGFAPRLAILYLWSWVPPAIGKRIRQYRRMGAS